MVRPVVFRGLAPGIGGDGGVGIVAVAPVDDVSGGAGAVDDRVGRGSISVAVAVAARAGPEIRMRYEAYQSFAISCCAALMSVRPAQISA